MGARRLNKSQSNDFIKLTTLSGPDCFFRKGLACSKTVFAKSDFNVNIKYNYYVDPISPEDIVIKPLWM